ncbi:MAG: FadR family transcriptional regulator [Pseudonocardia sp.]|nr:FadR family transcriptional regulator [Pseudonocardia sp.]
MTIPAERALRRLVADGVTHGTLGPGARLPTERELVGQLGAPRSAVRRALDALEQDGIVVRHVGRGTFLADQLHPVAATAPADTSPAEIMATRQLLEPQLARLAARSATQADLDRIEACLQRGAAASDAAGFESWDSALHRAIALATHNGLLVTLFDTMNAARTLPVWGSLKRRSSTPERRHCYHADHLAIVAALHERDGDAAADRMREHLTRVSEHMIGRH